MKFELHYWPKLVTVWFILSFLVSYIFAVLSKNVYPWFPYISEMGAWQPSSCIFGQMLNIAAVLTAIALYIRYKQIDFAINTNSAKLNKKWNEIAFWLGFVVSFGLSIVANFQANLHGYKGILLMHMIGAFMAFGIGGVYLVIQTKITFDLRPYYIQYPKFAVSKPNQYFRVFATIIFFISILLVVAFGAALGIATYEDGFNDLRPEWIKPGDAGYGFRLVSTISEWALAIVFLLYTLSVMHEFKALSFEGICFEPVRV